MAVRGSSGSDTAVWFRPLLDRPPRRRRRTARRLVQIYDGGAIPSAADHFFLAHPIELDGAEEEGGTATTVIDTTQPIVVDVLGRRTIGRRHPHGVRRRRALGRGNGRIKWRRLTRVLALQHPNAKSDALVGQCHQRQRFDNADLCDVAHDMVVWVLQRFALQTGLHRRPGGTPRDLLHERLLSDGHATVLFEPACHAVRPDIVQLYMRAFFHDILVGGVRLPGDYQYWVHQVHDHFVGFSCQLSVVKTDVRGRRGGARGDAARHGQRTTDNGQRTTTLCDASTVQPLRICRARASTFAGSVS